MKEEEYINHVVNEAHAYARALERANHENKAIANLPEARSWHDLKTNFSPWFIIDLCEAWRELQLIKSQSK